MAKKKTFIENNPALQFISTATEPEEQTAPKKAPEGYKVNPLYVEKRSRRLQLVLQPSLYDKIKAKAERAGTSVNEYIHNLLDEATREE